MRNTPQPGSPHAVRLKIALSVAVVAGFLVVGLVPGITAPLTGSARLATGSSDTLFAQAEASLAAGGGPAGGTPTSCSSTSSSSATCSASSSGSPAPSGIRPANTTGGQWVPVNYSRAFVSLAYDARDGYVLAFGGEGPSGVALGDTWKFAEGAWTLLLTSSAPSARWGAAMAYDDASSTVVLFGGTNGTAYFGDTWDYSGGIWTELSISPSPPARAFAAMAFDAYTTDGYTVLFGGMNATTAAFSDTWEFHDDSWTKLTTTGSPPALSGSSFAYDNRIGETVLFGGKETSGTYSAGTYLYRNLTWTTGPAGPTARAYAGMAYSRSASLKALVLFGGYDGSALGDTWELVNDTWTEVSASTAGLTAREGVSLAFDGLHPDFYVVLWGGVSGTSYTGDTWNFTASGWSEVTPGGSPPALTGAVLVNVPNQYEVLLFGGEGSHGATNATWIFSGGSWSLCKTCQGPSPRYGSAATYSSLLGGVILFGGFTGSIYLNDTWEFLDGQWTNVTATAGTAPPARYQAGFVYDPAPANYSVLFGGRNGTAYFGDTWKFAGTWTELTPSTSPSPRADPTMTYDEKDAYVLLFGGYNATQAYNDTWTYIPLATPHWDNVTSSKAPAARYGARASYDPYNGYVVMFGGYNFLVTFNDTWGYAGGTWVNFAPATFPPARVDAALSFDRGDKYLVQFGGTSSTGSDLGDTWLWVAFSAEATAFPDPTDVGLPVSFGVSAVAGVKPYSYAWAFGNGATSTEQTPVYAYPATGTYNASVVVTDSRMPLADQTSANVTVIVNPALSVVASATPTSAVVGYTVDFNSTATGGTHPLTYLWSFGDGATADTRNATHAYGTVGTYNATLVVNDTAGASVIETVTVHILPFLAAEVKATPTATDVGVAVTFNSTPIGGVGPYTYSWLFGDGSSAATENATHAYSVGGTYTVWYWVNDSEHHDFNTSLTIVVAPLPSATAHAAPNPVDAMVSVTFNGSVVGGTGPFTYLWAFGDGATATTANATHAYTTAGSYTATFSATDSVGTVAEANVTVTVAATPSVSGTASPSPTEVGVSTTFDSTVAGGSAPFTYSWVFGDGSSVPAQSANSTAHTYAKAGTYTVEYWANDSSGQSAHGTLSVTVEARIASTATATPTSTDVGVSVAFAGRSSGGVSPISYAWAFGDGAKAATQNASHAYAAVGSYHVFLWANDTLGVSAVSETNVTVVADPSISAFTVSPSSVTSGSSVTFSVTVAGGTAPFTYAYTGLPSGCTSASQTTLTCSPSSTGTFTVKVIATDAVGKTANATVSLSVTSSSSGTILGLSKIHFYELIAGIVVLVIVAIALALWARRRRKQREEKKEPTAEEAPPSEGAAPSETGTASSPPAGGQS